MEIWILNHYAKTPSYSGGTRHFDMAKALTEAGHNVTIFASSYSHTTKKDKIEYKENQYYKVEDVEKIRFIWIKTRGYTKKFSRVLSMFDYYFNTNKVIRKNFNFKKPDLIIGSAVHLLAPLLALKYAKKFKSTFYFEIRDFWPQTFIDFGKMSRFNPIALILYKLEKYLFNKADKIIVLFDRADRYIAERGISTDKVIYLPNGITETEIILSETQSIIPDKYNKMLKVVYIGSHGEANNLFEVLKLANKFKDNEKIVFLLFGDGPNKNLLKQESERMSLKNIEFFDPIEKKYIPHLLSLCDVGLISIKDSPLYRYGFSMNKIYDYLYAGLPITMIVDPSYAPTFDRSGIFVSNDLDEQVQLLKKIMNDKSLYKLHSNSAKELSKEFIWSNQIKKIEKYF